MAHALYTQTVNEGIKMSKQNIPRHAKILKLVWKQVPRKLWLRSSGAYFGETQF